MFFSIPAGLSERNLKICKALILSIYPIFISFAEDQDRHKSSKMNHVIFLLNKDTNTRYQLRLIMESMK